MSHVRLEHLTHSYPGHGRAVDDVTLDIDDGELVTLVGPSGSGKTTLLRLVAGLERPDAGRMHIDGRDVGSEDPFTRGITMVTQDGTLYDHLSVRRNLALALDRRVRSKDEIARQVEAMAERLEIRGFLDRKAHTLSGGERQRVALGRALLPEPSCCLLDEPLAHLDAQGRRELRQVIRAQRAEQPVTMLYVTHDQEEALAMGDRVVVMSRGRVMQTGTPEEVYTHPSCRFVAGFVGHPPMNFLPVQVERHGEGVHVRHGDACVELARADVPDGDATLGVRPDALRVNSAAGGLQLRLVTESIETVGPFVDITGRTSEGARVEVRLPWGVEVPETLVVRAETNALYLFV